MAEAKRFLRGAVATPHYLASAAGAAVLADGGNAIDAMIAANLALGVVAPYYCGYGGDLLAMVHDGTLHGYLSVGRAPEAATVDAVRTASGSATMPLFGPHAVTVPGAVRGWFTLLERWGSRSFGDLATTAIRLAEEGFPLTDRGAKSFEFVRALHGRDAYAAPLISRYSEEATQPGAVLRHETLARTIRTLAADGPGAYYRGPIGDAIVNALGEIGGLMTTDDLDAHTDTWVDPLSTQFRDLEVFELPPPTQGVTVLESLALLDPLDLGADDSTRHHLMVEAIKLALATRDEFVGDPDAMTLTPADLLDDTRIKQRRGRIDPTRRTDPSPHDSPDGGTAYMCCADADGLMISLIQSNFAPVGSGVHVQEWGINLHNRGSSFRLEESHPNAIGPRKRPMHTLVPAFATRDGEPWLVFGTEGGHRQAQTQVQLLARLALDGTELQTALDAPRWGVDPGTWKLDAERRFGDEWMGEMRAKGHDVHSRPAFDIGTGMAHAIAPSSGAGIAVATDRRAEGAALGA